MILKASEMNLNKTVKLRRTYVLGHQRSISSSLRVRKRHDDHICRLFYLHVVCSSISSGVRIRFSYETV